MDCPRCRQENKQDIARCEHCGSNLAIALLEVLRGEVPEKMHFLRQRSYTLGRARTNDLCLSEPSVSKSHARIVWEDGHFFIEDDESRHGVYVNGVRVERSPLTAGTQVQLGNLSLGFSLLSGDTSTDSSIAFPWVEQQQLLLSLVQALSSTLVVSQVLDQVVDGVVRITRAERGFLLLADSPGDDGPFEHVAGLRLRAARTFDGDTTPKGESRGLSGSVIRRALETRETVATGDALLDPSLGNAASIVALDLRTIVCIPLPSPRGDTKTGVIGVLYVDNQKSSAPFSPESLRAAEALARHASLAIENARLFEREQRTIEELRRAQKQLLQSEKLATIGQMAAGIAHEINTPLTYIMGNVELLSLQTLAPAQNEMLDSISRGAERLRGLAESLLAFSRPAREEMLRTDINGVVDRALELCRYQILKAGVLIERVLEPALPPVMGVPSQLEMALINLVVNALQAMGSGGGRLTVRTRRSGDDVELLVEDSGPGVPESIRHTLFEPFVSTKPEGQGTGLGLSTVLMIVERHRGRIDFSSESGRGTVFCIHLPSARPASSPGSEPFPRPA